MKIYKKIILLFIVIGIIILSLGSYIILFKEDKVKNTNKDIITEEVSTEEKYITIVLSINPKIALVIDENGNIVNMIPLNSDAEIFKKEDFEGIKVEKAVEKVVEVAESYLEEKPEITISFEDEEGQEEINIKSIESLFNSKGIKTKKLKLEDKESKEIKEKIKEEKKKEEKSTTNTTTTTNKKTTTEKTTIVTTTNKIKSNNNYLKFLKIDNIKIDLKKDIFDYETYVNYDVNSVNIKANAEDNKATIIGNGTKTLSVGKNLFVIKIIAENGEIKEYNIRIIRRALINLNDNKTYTYSYETANDEYVYPNNKDCMGKMPGDVVIPEGMSYNDYCQNTPPTNYPDIEGLGYYCIKKDAYNNSTSMTVNKVYECHYIHEFADFKNIKSRVNRVVKVENYVGFAGGYGIDPISIKLDEKKCKEFNLSCDRW